MHRQRRHGFCVRVFDRALARPRRGAPHAGRAVAAAGHEPLAAHHHSVHSASVPLQRALAAPVRHVPDLDRVVVAAGVLEDPFSAAELPGRVPSLVGRMVQRLRRRRRGSPFLDLQSTMSTQGSLKLLGLPTAAGYKLTLAEIREAYRQKALANHPDAGGNEEEMRRLNEAYQLLKQRFIRPN